MEENTRLGQAFVLFGLLSVVGGVGLFVLTEAFAFEEGTSFLDSLSVTARF